MEVELQTNAIAHDDVFFQAHCEEFHGLKAFSQECLERHDYGLLGNNRKMAFSQVCASYFPFRYSGGTRKWRPGRGIYLRRKIEKLGWKQVVI